jgi:hypothetical protein
MEEQMRLNFHNIEQPKRIAKNLAKRSTAKLSASQAAVAKIAGYKDWHDLSKALAHENHCPLFEDASIEVQAKLIVEAAEFLLLDAGEVQFAFSEAGAFKSLASSYAHQLDLRARCFRLTSIPDLGAKQPGSVGIAKCWKNEPVILKKYGPGISCISNKHWNSHIADFEYRTPRTPPPLFVPRRLFVLYGMWIEADGSKVLYSRDYEPIWRIRDGRRPERTKLTEIIQPVERIGFWDDTSTPWRSEERYAEEIERIKSYGIIGLPQKVELLPSLIRDDQESGD